VDSKATGGARIKAEARIRRVEPEDEAAFHALWRDFVRDGPEPCPDEAATHVWRSVMGAAAGMDMLVALDDEATVAGFALYLVHPYSWTARPLCYLLDLFVAEPARGRGLATALMARLAEMGRSRGWLKVYWLTQHDNEKARAVYDRIAAVSPLVRYDMLLNPYESDGS